MEVINTIWDTLVGFNTVSAITRVILAVVIGGIIGNERGRHGSPAGLRTHILVCVGSTVTSLTGLYVIQSLNMSGDPFRIAAQVVSGIGFLGAGMIIVKSSNIITGLTTAAGLWATAAIGVALGYGFYLVALIAMLACVFTAAFLTRFERKRKMAIHIYAELSAAEHAGKFADTLRSEFNNDISMTPIPAKSGLPGHIGFEIVTSNSVADSEYRTRIEAIEDVVFAICE